MAPGRGISAILVIRAEFRLWREGDRVFNAVVVTKDINIFDEMTIYYGYEYFKAGINCLCGEDNCEYSAEAKAEKRLKYKHERQAKIDAEKARIEEEEAETDHEEEGGGEEGEEGKEGEEGEKGEEKRKREGKDEEIFHSR